ncbi:MAG: helix-turn-helix transcriptional regulator [Clostridia bacterium]|nr:helix-turn-helix transcriptional regulator [Clostridia bacterium]
MAIDYAAIGKRIKQKRIENGLSQEKLAEMVGIGPSHMSHIEGGTTTPSFEVFISIVNSLNCSADDLLMREVSVAKQLRHNWLTKLTEDCSTKEIKIISDIVSSAIETLRKNQF